MSDIDKDIEKVRKLAKGLKTKFEKYVYEDAILPRIYEEDVQAIENVLSELERQTNIARKEYNEHMEKKRQNEVLENNNRILDKELETYKKIAEKLAEECNMTKRATNIDSDNDWCNGTVYMTTEEKLDWAIKEVENENNKNEI